MRTPHRILPVIVASQFAGTSLWFAGNAVLPDIQARWSLPATAVATVTSAVQTGFVLGTLAFAMLMLADRLRRTQLVWGVTAAGGSPQFSALTARNAPAGAVGSVLTSSNSIGFAISVASIEALVRLAQALPLESVLPWLAAGPALGLWALRPLLRRR